MKYCYIFKFTTIIPPCISCLSGFFQEFQVKPDLDFYNYLCWRRALRKDHDATESIVKELSTSNIQPNIKLFSVLAMSCDTAEKCKNLLLEMQVCIFIFFCEYVLEDPEY